MCRHHRNIFNSTGIKGLILTGFMLSGLLLLSAPAKADGQSLAHDWNIYGDVELMGFQTRNEPIIGEDAGDDTGLLTRLSLGVTYRYRDLFSANVKIVSEGASRYGLVIGDDHPSFYGVVESASGSDYLPVVDTAELRFQTPEQTFWISGGLIRAHRFSKYALPGALVGARWNELKMEAWWVDAGKRATWHRQEVQLENGLKIEDTVKAAFYGARFWYDWPRTSLGVEVTMLNDTTPASDRWNIVDQYWGDINEDQIGTITAYFCGVHQGWIFDVEFSRNFGHSVSANGNGEFNYTGYRADLNLAWRHGAWTLGARYLYQSGNPFPSPGNSSDDGESENNSADDSEDKTDTEEPPFRDFKGFAYYPPTNGALYDSHYFQETGPPVLLGTRLTPCYGISRPTQFGDNSAPSNLQALALTCHLEPVPEVTLLTTIWKLNAPEVSWFQKNDKWFQPSDDLGIEVDAELIWQPFSHMALKAFYGICLLGDFYKELNQESSGGLDYYQPIYEWVKVDRVELMEIGVTIWI